MKAVTLRQPWAAAVACFGMDILNCGWGTSYRGSVAVYVGTRRPAARDMVELAELIADRAGVTASQVMDAATTGGGVIALASLTGVCTTTRARGGGRCGCGVWAVPGRTHLRLTDVQRLPEPVPATGSTGGQSLWPLPYRAEKAVRAQLAALRPSELAGVRPPSPTAFHPRQGEHYG